jgi:hypothetical protein
MISVFPVALSIAMHQLIDGDPCILFIQNQSSAFLTMPTGYMMGKEQPNKTGLRIINSTFGLGLSNARLRCYLAYLSDSDPEPKVILYHTLRMYDEECQQIEAALADNGKKFLAHRWVSVAKTDDLGADFDQDIRRNWKTIRQCVNSNYNKK